MVPSPVRAFYCPKCRYSVPRMFKGVHVWVGVQRGELQPCTASFDSRRPPFLQFFSTENFSPGQKLTWTLKSFKRIILNSECRRLPALGLHKSRNKTVFLELKECQETKWNWWREKPGGKHGLHAVLWITAPSFQWILPFTAGKLSLCFLWLKTHMLRF